MKMRPFAASDRNELLDVFKLNVPFFFASHEADEYEKYLKLNGSTYFTLEMDNRVVGGIGYIINGHEGSITWIFLHPDYSGFGLGKRAVEHCLGVLKSEKHITKFVVRTSQLACSFFEKFGYKVTYSEKNYWGEGLDLYQMEMSNVY